MGILRNPRHEKFAQLLASGVSATQAYVSCGYSENGAAQSANALLKRTQVSDRVSELKEMAAYSSAHESVLNRTRVRQRLDHLSRKAEAAGQLSAAARCEELIGKELGMFVDRSDQKHTIKRLEDIPQEVLEEAIRVGEAQLAAMEEKSKTAPASDDTRTADGAGGQESTIKAAVDSAAAGPPEKELSPDRSQQRPIMRLEDIPQEVLEEASPRRGGEAGGTRG